MENFAVKGQYRKYQQTQNTPWLRFYKTETEDKARALARQAQPGLMILKVYRLTPALKKVVYVPATGGFEAIVTLGGKNCLQVSRATSAAKLEVAVGGHPQAAEYKDLFVQYAALAHKQRVRDLVGDLFAEWKNTELTKKKQEEIKTLCRKATLYRTYRHATPDDYDIMAMPYNEETAAYLRETFGELLVEIVNERFLAGQQTTLLPALAQVEDDF